MLSGWVNFLFLPDHRTSREICSVSRSKWSNITSIGSSQVFWSDSSALFKRHFLSWFICGCFSVPGQYRPFHQSFDGAYFPECNVVFVALEKDIIARIEIFIMERDGFLELRSPWNESIEDGRDFSCKHCFYRWASHRCVRIWGYPIHLQKLLKCSIRRCI